MPKKYTKKLLCINKYEAYLTENEKQRIKNIKVIIIYIQSTQSNIVKTGSEQIEQMSFSLFPV